MNLRSVASFLSDSASRNSHIHRVPTGDGEHFVVAKVARTPGPAMAKAMRKEYSALEEVNTSAGNALGISVPSPLLFVEEQGILVVSGVAGSSLESTLRRQANVLNGRLRHQSLQRIGMLVGNWLRHFHDVTVAGDQPHHHNDYLRELDSNLYRSRQFGLSASALQKIRDGVEATSATLNGTNVPMAAAHGDFLPQNILIGETGAGVVDFGSYWHEAPVYRDLSHLSAYLALLASRPAYDRSALESLKRGFIAGYGRTLNADLLRIYEVNATLRIINDRSSVLTARRSRKIERLLLTLSAVATATPRDL